jgi:hypothetical protein
MSSIDFDSVIVASSEGITYQKSIHKILDLKTLRYHLDSEELIQFIMKLINNKAFW